ncbi:MAG: hypothetical protein UU84_C0024G0002 [Candidatus Yanofskybacteria bacterium GW2011_GWC2_41_9]|uniref:Uncharacterized protein n=1 Tax=Candidatus Yanofskybacteria bacterium GW2011_GWC2_41_9 TaxID=1619029 RepID=A0A0G1AMX4_9BACT|nr:MAG: hypothetical protein UU84_C0024G0002 [Candidatus Yanofskybacteria bacterium GW2011_GWC2_41_9]
MQKIIIGLAGQKGAGKGLFVEFLSEAARKRNLTVQQFKSSDILTEMLNIVGIVAERANLQTLASLLVSGFGNGVISEAVRVKMEKSPADIVIARRGARGRRAAAAFARCSEGCGTGVKNRKKKIFLSANLKPKKKRRRKTLFLK